MLMQPDVLACLTGILTCIHVVQIRMSQAVCCLCHTKAPEKLSTSPLLCGNLQADILLALSKPAVRLEASPSCPRHTGRGPLLAQILSLEVAANCKLVMRRACKYIQVQDMFQGRPSYRLLIRLLMLSPLPVRCVELPQPRLLVQLYLPHVTNSVLCVLTSCIL